MLPTNNPVDELVTLYDIQQEFSLDRTTVWWLRERLANVASERVGNLPYLYPRNAVLEALRQRKPRKAKPLSIGSFEPSTDLAWCRCGRSFIDATALQAHVELVHGGTMPAEQATQTPHYQPHMSWHELKASVQAELKGATK